MFFSQTRGELSGREPMFPSHRDDCYRRIPANSDGRYNSGSGCDTLLTSCFILWIEAPSLRVSDGLGMGMYGLSRARKVLVVLN